MTLTCLDLEKLDEWLKSWKCPANVHCTGISYVKNEIRKQINKLVSEA